MPATRTNRITRGYSFTFDNEGDKEKYHAHAKRKGMNLAVLIKALLAADMVGSAPTTAPQGGGGQP